MLPYAGLHVRRPPFARRPGSKKSLMHVLRRVMAHAAHDEFAIALLPFQDGTGANTESLADARRN